LSNGSVRLMMVFCHNTRNVKKETLPKLLYLSE